MLYNTLQLAYLTGKKKKICILFTKTGTIHFIHL